MIIDKLIGELFVRDDPDAEQPIAAMPGVSRFGVNRLEEHLVPLVANGLSSVLLFGVPFDLPKDGRGSCADEPTTPVILAIKKIKKLFPSLVIACDVSLQQLAIFKLVSGNCLIWADRFAFVLTPITAIVEFFVKMVL